MNFVKDLINAAVDDVHVILVALGLGFGIILFFGLKHFVEPWIIEAICEHLWKCGQ